jgi:hypothetical protein
MIGVFWRAKRKRAFYRTIGIGIDTCSEYSRCRRSGRFSTSRMARRTAGVGPWSESGFETLTRVARSLERRKGLGDPET